MHQRIRAGLNAMTAQNLAEQILTGSAEIPEMMLCKEALRTFRGDQYPASEVERLVEIGLSGSDAGVSRACLAKARAIPGRISTVLLDLLAHAKCDAAVWLVLREHVEWVDLPGGDGGRTLISKDGGDVPGAVAVFDTHVELADGITWVGNGIIDISVPKVQLPETVTVSAAGRPLADLISHPALDAHHLMVTAYAESDGYAEIICSHPSGPWNTRSTAFADLKPDMLHPAKAFV